MKKVRCLNLGIIDKIVQKDLGIFDKTAILASQNQ